MKTREIRIRDPFVLVDGGRYCLYSNRLFSPNGGGNGFDAYTGTDLENWDGPFRVFDPPEGFWADGDFWAPEVHLYKGMYYLFATFKAGNVCRGTQILRSGSPLGPFLPWSDGPVTPRGWECLDGTLYIDKNAKPHMVFCHEWLQVMDGEICSVPLSDDLKTSVGEPKLLFTASSAPFTKPVREGCYVTDGPFFHRTEKGGLLMIWSGNSKNGYMTAVARSCNGEINGNFTHCEPPLFDGDGGHGMIFRDLGGDLRLTLHAPGESGFERAYFFDLIEEDDIIKITEKPIKEEKPC